MPPSGGFAIGTRLTAATQTSGWNGDPEPHREPASQGACLAAFIEQPGRSRSAVLTVQPPARADRAQ